MHKALFGIGFSEEFGVLLRERVVVLNCREDRLQDILLGFEVSEPKRFFELQVFVHLTDFWIELLEKGLTGVGEEGFECGLQG